MVQLLYEDQFKKADASWAAGEGGTTKVVDRAGQSGRF